jgi:DNA invertase Pin-like site-specific DNA recombinase
MRVAIYSRFSTDTQDVTSIAGQVANCEALAARESLDVVARIEDEGISGNDDNRPGYKQLLGLLEDGSADGILCDETSRITRNQAELHRLVAELRFRDQFLLTVDGVDTRSESSEILLSVKAAIDQMESRKVATRTYRSLRERHKAGHAAGGRIFGYRTVSDGAYKKRVIDPIRQRSSKKFSSGMHKENAPKPLRETSMGGAYPRQVHTGPTNVARAGLIQPF